MSTVDLNKMSYQDVVDHLSGSSGKGDHRYVRADQQTEAERQASFESQRYARQRYRDIWVPRRDALRGIFQHKVQGMSVAFNAATSLTQLVFNARNPMTLMSNAFRFAVSITSEVIGHVRKGSYARRDAIDMQNVIWNHVYDDVLPILLKRPLKEDGTLMEVPEVRKQMLGIMNDEYILKPSPDGRPVDHNTRRKIARLLDCQYDEGTSKLVLNEDRFGKRYIVDPVSLPKLATGPELQDPKEQKVAAPKIQAPAPAMA